MSRIKNILPFFEPGGFDACLVTDDINIRYLTGFPAHESWLFISKKKSFYLTDARYYKEVSRHLSGIDVRQCRGSLTKEMFSLAASLGLKTVALDPRHVSLALYRELKNACPAGLRFVSKSGLVERLRLIKDPGEVALIRKALALNLEVYSYLRRILAPGMTERELLCRLQRHVRSKGAEFSFDPIIASGPNSCFPHARVTDRKLRQNEPLLVDMGIEVEGYKSDLTRMFFLGKISSLVIETCEIVAAAQKAAIDKIRPGVSAAEVDQQARNFLKKRGLSKFFQHSLGC